MDGAEVGVDHQLAIGPLRIFVSADEEFEGESFEHEIVSGLKIVIGKSAENGARFGECLGREVRRRGW